MIILALLLTLALTAALTLGYVRTVTTVKRTAPVPFQLRRGVDARGNTWLARRLDPASVRLYRAGLVWVDAGGMRTLAHMTSRYGIRWDA